MHKPSSQNSSHYILKEHLIPYFGQMPMDAISEGTVQEWISGLELQGKLEPKTIANMGKVLKLIIGKPTREWTIRLPEIPETEQRYFTPKEMQQLIDGFNKFRTPDMVSRKRVRFLPPDERARPNSACEAEDPGTACLSCLAPHKEPRELVTDVVN